MSIEAKINNNMSHCIFSLTSIYYTEHMSKVLRVHKVARRFFPQFFLVLSTSCFLFFLIFFYSSDIHELRLTFPTQRCLISCIIVSCISKDISLFVTSKKDDDELSHFSSSFTENWMGKQKKSRVHLTSGFIWYSSTFGIRFSSSYTTNRIKLQDFLYNSSTLLPAPINNCVVTQQYDSKIFSQTVPTQWQFKKKNFFRNQKSVNSNNIPLNKKWKI